MAVEFPAAERDTRIGTLRVRTSSGDRPGLRLGVTRMLENADLRPPGMPPAAILIIRQLTDPLPGRGLPRSGAVRADARWQRAVRSAVSDLFRLAARPVREAVGPGASAVLFADEGEMLASLALDIARGRSGDHWWWRVSLRSMAAAAGNRLQGLLCTKTRQLPAIMSCLANWGEAEAVVGSLDAPEATSVLRALVGEHGLSGSLLSSPPAGVQTPRSPFPAALDPESSTPERRSGREVPPPGSGGAAHRRLRPPPWRAWLPADRAFGLTPEQECLLGVGLALHHAPSRARSPLFAAQVGGWRQEAGPTGEGEPTRRPGPSRSDNAARNRSAALPASAGRKPDQMRPSRFEPPAAPSVSLREPPATSSPADKSDERSPERRMDGEKGALEASGTAPPSINPRTHPEREPASAQDQDPALGAGDEPIPAGDDSLYEGVETRLGGVLYLINLLDYLGLPGCFEASWCLSSRLGGWGLLDAVARALLGAAWESFAGDPLWIALAELDGREARELPGPDFAGGDGFRLPVEWFEAVSCDGEAFRWAASGGRLRVWSAAGEGYVLVDVPLGAGSPADRASRELSRYSGSADDGVLSAGLFKDAPSARLSTLLAAELNRDLARWLTLAIPYIRHRLRQAMGFGAPGSFDLATELLLVPGWLYVTPTHVDLVAALDAISVRARLAGLDRDPGWVPDLGRVVSFHFE
jgi:hypothetical protein